MAIQTSKGACVVRAWKRSAETRQMTPFGTRLAAIARLWCVVARAEAATYRPRPTRVINPSSLASRRYWRGILWASRSRGLRTPALRAIFAIEFVLDIERDFTKRRLLITSAYIS